MKHQWVLATLHGTQMRHLDTHCLTKRQNKLPSLHVTKASFYYNQTRVPVSIPKLLKTSLNIIWNLGQIDQIIIFNKQKNKNQIYFPHETLIMYSNNKITSIWHEDNKWLKSVLENRWALENMKLNICVGKAQVLTPDGSYPERTYCMSSVLFGKEFETFWCFKSSVSLFDLAKNPNLSK